jgi:hypothetical protein
MRKRKAPLSFLLLNSRGDVVREAGSQPQEAHHHDVREVARQLQRLLAGAPARDKGAERGEQPKKQEFSQGSLHSWSADRSKG